MTESTAPLTANRVGDLRAGSVGTPLPGVTVRISSQGEILIKGCGVSKGYRNPALNEENFEDGFLRTGDLGELDDAGHLNIRGRIKNVIVTSNGKTVSPAEWESIVETHPLVAHAVMLGEAKPHLTSLIVLDADEVKKWAMKKGTFLPSLPQGGVLSVKEKTVFTAVQEAVDRANSLWSRAEQVRHFIPVLADLSVAGGLVTPTLKLKRSVFLSHARALVEGLYRDSGTSQ